MKEIFKDFKIIKPDNVNSSEKKYTCLNVGKERNVGKELEIDFERMKHFKEYKGEKQYINQFNEEVFKYEEYATRQEWVYKDISEKYKSIITILVAKENNYTIEKYFAYSFKAVYWVSGGRYSSNKIIDDFEIDRIRKGIDVSKIDDSLKLKIEALKKAYDNQ